MRGIVQPSAVLARAQSLVRAQFLLQHGLRGFLVLGAVVLVVTGGEALYADMGHFGARPIRLAWFVVVLPALVLNYFGQGALLLVQPGGGAQSVLLRWCRAGPSTRWWCWPPRRRWWRRRRSSRARSR